MSADRPWLDYRPWATNSIFGYPLTTRRLAAADFRKIEISQGATMKSGNKTTVYYQLYVHGRDTRPFPLAERLTSRAEAELLSDTYLAYLGTAPGRVQK